MYVVIWMTDKITKIRKKIENMEEIEDVVLHDWGDDWISATIVFDGDS